MQHLEDVLIQSAPSVFIQQPQSVSLGIVLLPEWNRRYNSAMSPDAQRILDEALQLPPDEREWLAEQLLTGANEEAFSALEKEVGEPEPGYEEWFRAGVEEALADKSPGIPHEQVMKEIGGILRAARVKQGLKESA